MQTIGTPSSARSFRLRLRGYLADVARGFERAPVEMALALFLAIAFSAFIRANDDPGGWFELAITTLLVFVVAWSATLLHALGAVSARTRWAATITGALVVAAYGAFVVDFTREAEAWRAVVLVAGAVLWLVAVPAFGTHEDAVARMRRVDGRVLLRTMAVLLYALALYLGLVIAIAAVNTLFELELDSKIFLHVFGWIFFVLVPWVVVGGLDDYVRPPAGNEAVATAVHRLTLYLVPPLLAIYFLILYAYMVRIGVTGEIPKNLVSPMVLAACALTSLALLLFDPAPGGAPFARALRLAPPLLLPLTPLGAWALIQRVDQYGWTEFRAIRLVALGAFTALAILATIQLVRRRVFALHVLPLVLAATAVLAVVGPWSTLALSRRSQQARLDASLAQVEAVRPDSLHLGRPVRTVPAELYDRIQTDARYVQLHFGRDALPAPLAQHVGSDEAWVDFSAALSLQRMAGTGGPDRFFSQRLAPGVAVQAGGVTLYRIEFAPLRERGGTPASLVTADSLRLMLHLPSGVLYADLEPLLHTVPPTGRGTFRPEDAVVPLRDAQGNVRGELVVFEASAQQGKDGRMLQHVAGTVLVR